MKLKYFGFKNTVYLMFISILCIFVYSSNLGIVRAQKPSILKRNTDDQQLCKGTLQESQFCSFFEIYNRNKGGNTTEAANAAKIARDEMIEILRGQVDDYYKSHKDGRRLKADVFQMIFDILEIGTATTIGFINGERAKSVLATVLTGFQGGRSAFNKNFKVLQMQILINKMNTDRNLILTQIYENTGKNVEEYSWLKAKNDLRNYLFAGTFGNAMDSLVEKTGDDAEDAEKAMEEAKRNAGVKGFVSPRAMEAANTNFGVLVSLLQTYVDAADKQDASKVTDKQREILAKYKKIYGQILANDKLAAKLNKLPENTNFSENLRAKLKGILQKLENNQTVTAEEYDNLFTKLNTALETDEALTKAYTTILSENKK